MTFLTMVFVRLALAAASIPAAPDAAGLERCGGSVAPVSDMSGWYDSERLLLLKLTATLIVETYRFAPEVVEDILWVARETSMSPLLLASVVDRESEGLRTAASYCGSWATPVYNSVKKSWNKPCLRSVTCRKGCRTTRTIWKNHLDLGLWQLRDVVEKTPDGRFAGWSWLRWYSRTSKTRVTSDCAFDRECSRLVMAAIVPHLEKWALTSTDYSARCPGVPPEWRWLGGWNGCSSALNHAKRATELHRLLKARLELGHLLYDLSDMALGVSQWLTFGTGWSEI